MKAKNNAAESNYSSMATGITALAAPIASVEYWDSSYDRLSWDDVPGATEYEILYKAWAVIDGIPSVNDAIDLVLKYVNYIA